jgi:hypothetical protein
MYRIAFGVIVLGAALLAVWCWRKLGGTVTVIIGALMTILTVVLFFLNKSDSVADTFLEKLADLSPPLITGSIVIGWWVGYCLARVYARVFRSKL